jgi:hypothetical protein
MLCWNREFHFGACARRAPHCELTTGELGAFAHPGETEVSLSGLDGKRMRIDPMTIVAHAQTKLSRVVAQLDLDSRRARVQKRVSDRFRRDAVAAPRRSLPGLGFVIGIHNQPPANCALARGMLEMILGGKGSPGLHATSRPQPSQR